MKTKAKPIWVVMNIISWIVFILLCIKTGALLISFFVSLFINPAGAQDLHLGLNLSNLYRYNVGHYVAIVSIIILLSALKARIFYLIILIFLKVNLVQPFSSEVSLLISRIGYVALGIGALTLIGNGYTEWLIKKGVAFPDLQAYLGAGEEFLFFAGIIFFIGQVFKRGIEIQSENELTV
jgi:hypothetical protein